MLIALFKKALVHIVVAPVYKFFLKPVFGENQNLHEILKINRRVVEILNFWQETM